MRNQSNRPARVWPATGILAATLTAFWAVVPAAAGPAVQINRVSLTLLEITGEGWRLRYGTMTPSFGINTLLLPAEGNRVYFTHGGWLRLIDTEKGQVVGRWHFPGQIVRMLPMGHRIQIEIENAPRGDLRLPQTFIFDPSKPQVAYWEHGWTTLYRLSQRETGVFTSTASVFQENRIVAELAKKFIPEIEEMARRDPLSPWFRIALGKLLRDAGDARATTVFQEALRVPAADPVELLGISAFLDRASEHELAGAFFERGYRDYLAFGNDPRLFVTLMGRLTVYYPFPNQPGGLEKLPFETRRELIENIYRIAPGGEGAQWAWRIYASYLEKNGRADEGRLWRARSEDGASSFPTSDWLLSLDRVLLVVFASLLSAPLYILILSRRYRPQRRLDRAAETRAAEARGSPLVQMKFWSWPERVLFFAVVIGVWLVAYKWVSVMPGARHDPVAFIAFLASYFVFPVALLFIVILYLRYARRRRLAQEEQTQPVRFSALDVDRWTRAERIVFLVVLLGGWLFGFLAGSPHSEPFPRAFLAIYGSLAAALVYLLVLHLRYWPRRRALATIQQARRRSWLGFAYWGRRERIAFLTIAFAGWFAAGISTEYFLGIWRVATTPIGTQMGSYAGPGTIWFFENRLPPTPERELLLAVAYQQSGEKEKAESLYRRLPSFAESWNNLGVVLREAGKEGEARQAFERALQLDPDLAEAALNLGRPPGTLWTELHQKYLPGRPMLAPPKRDRVERAFLGGSSAKIYSRSLAWPLASLFGRVGYFGYIWGVPDAGPRALLKFVRVLGLIAVAVLFLVPSRQVTQPPGKMQWIWEALFPGSSPSWGFLGGIVLLAWSYLMAQDVLLFWKGIPYLLTAISSPNLARAYGIPGSSEAEFRRLINPSWIWVYLAPAVLFVVNLVLAWRGRRQAESSS